MQAESTGAPDRSGTRDSILVVARGFFEAFPVGLSEEAVRVALLRLGWSRLHEVAPRLAPFLDGLLKQGSGGHPAFSAACPPANEWLRRERPDLAALLSPDPSPAEEALLCAAREAIAARDGAGRRRAHLVFVSPCPAKAEAMRDFAQKLGSQEDFAGLSFEVMDLVTLRAGILDALGLPADGPPRPEARPRLPPGLLFVEGEAGLSALAETGFPEGTLAVLPFWCEGGCNGSAFGAGSSGR